MINLSDLGQFYIVCGKTDMRRGIDSLGYIIKSRFELDPFSGEVFLFCGGKDLKPYIGTVKVSGCFINALRVENFHGLIMKMKFKSYQLNKLIGS